MGGKHDPRHIGTASTSTDRGTPGQVVYDSGRGPTTSGYDQPTSGTGLTASGRDQQPIGSGHHLGRDAGLVGVGGVGAYEADKHLGKKDHSHDVHGADPSASNTTDLAVHRYERDAAPGAAAGSEFSKTAAGHDAKQELKDQKHHQKEIEKEQKHHQKEVAAAEKKHEKEFEKAEKKHEKVEHHEEKKHHGGILGLFKRLVFHSSIHKTAI